MRRSLTKQEKGWAEALKRKWLELKSELSLTQEKAADQLGWSSQAAVAQYLNGKIPLNVTAMLKFAKLLKVPAQEIWPNAEILIGVGAGNSNNESHAKDLAENDINSGVEDFFASLNTRVLGQKYQNTSNSVRLMVDELLDMPPREAERFVALYRTAKDEIYNGRDGK